MDERESRSGTCVLIAGLLVGLGCLAATRSWWSPAPPDGIPEDVGRRVDLNTADAGALTTLPGIGPVLAERIVAERTAGGPFRDLDDLAGRVKGVGPALALALSDRVVTP